MIKNARICVKTDVGYKRKTNEDSYIIVDYQTLSQDILNYGKMYALADGMGGHAGGQMDSKIA